MAFRSLLVATGLVVLAAGCGDSGLKAKPKPAPAKESIIASRLEPTRLPKVLPPQVCSVGIRLYDVMLFGVRLRPEDSCALVAGEVFRGERQLPWAREHYLASDQVEECELARGGGRLQVLRDDPDLEGPRFDAAYDLSERACAGLERAGWRVIFQEK